LKSAAPQSKKSMAMFRQKASFYRSVNVFYLNALLPLKSNEAFMYNANDSAARKRRGNE
jgi:hypothetical protein